MKPESIEFLKLQMIETFLKKGDEVVMMSPNGKEKCTWTGNEMAAEIIAETAFGLETIDGILQLSIDMIIRGKKKLEKTPVVPPVPEVPEDRFIKEGTEPPKPPRRIPKVPISETEPIQEGSAWKAVRNARVRELAENLPVKDSWFDKLAKAWWGKK